MARGAELAAEQCASCHHRTDDSSAPEQPRIAGQNAPYLTWQLNALRAGLRPSKVMNEVAAGLSDQDIADLVAYWSSVKPTGSAWAGQDASLVAQGRKLFESGSVSTGLIACTVCHGEQGQGIRELAIPRISGQAPRYLKKALQEFAMVPDFGLARPNAMHTVASTMTHAELDAIVAYLASTPWGKQPVIVRVQSTRRP